MSEKKDVKAAPGAKKGRGKPADPSAAVAQAAVDEVNQRLQEEALVAAGTPVVVIHQHFLNDLSVENPAGILDARAAQAKLGQRIQVDVANRDGDPATFGPGEPTHQVTVGLQLSAELEGRTIFMAEMRYRALVEVRNLDEAQVMPALFVMIPEAMYPALKEVMERTGGYAGYPALTVQPIDFALIYAENQKRQAEDQSAEGKSATKAAKAEAKPKAAAKPASKKDLH